MNEGLLLWKIEKSLNSGFKWLEDHMTGTLMILFFVSLVIRLAVAPFGMVLREDAFIYLKKALEITAGNFTPPLSQPVGWSLFMAVFFKIWKSPNLLKNMVYARVLSIVVGSSLIFPIYAMAKKFLKRQEVILLLIFFVFSSQLILSAASAMTEPLFMLLFYLSIYFVYLSMDNQKYILVSAFFAGLAYYVRSNGIFILAIIVISLFLMEKSKSRYRYIAYVFAIFLATSAPFLYQRYKLFGSPTFYGPNSKFFVDDYQKVWCNNVPIPSLFDYLRTHSIYQWFEKFIIHGFFELVFLDFIYHILTALLAFPFIYGIVRFVKKREHLPLVVTMMIWIIGLTPVWDLFDNPRHLYPLVPIVLIFTSIAIYDMFDRHKYCNLLKFLFLAIFISFSLISPIQEKVNPKDGYIKDGLPWAEWIAKNVKGKIAIIEGGDLVMMHLPDTVVGGVGQYDLYAPESGLSTVRPGCFDDLFSAMKWFEKIGVTHIVVDDLFSFKRPYLKKLFLEKQPPSFLTEIYSNVHSDLKWKVRVFRIDWATFDKIVKNKSKQ